MNPKIRHMAIIAQIAALYAVLFYAQNFILPGSASMAVQFRVAEALNVLALFTPYAIPGLTLGCVISNLSGIASGLPLDMIFGSVATLIATSLMYLLRNAKIKSYPLPAMLMPALLNGIIVGWEIEVFYVEGEFEWIGFLTQGSFVALGELGVMLVLGTILYYAVKKRRIDKMVK